MNNSSLSHAICAGLLFFLSPTLSAALIDSGNGLVYEDDRDITWLANANYGAIELSDTRVNEIITAVGSVAGHTLVASDFIKDSGGDYTGQMTWWGAIAWADQLTFNGASDWRLPNTLIPDFSCSGTTPDDELIPFGINCIGSEMGHLFYDELLGIANQSILTSGDETELAKFSNIQPAYWSSTEKPVPDFESMLSALHFSFQGGVTGFNGKDLPLFFAWAVHDGDVGASPVPVPAAIWFFGSGLIGLIGFARKKVT